MFISFYNAAVGANTQQQKLDVIANNIANTSTDGYKTQSASFVDLLYSNMKAPVTEQSRLKNGAGVRVEKTDVLHINGAIKETGGQFDFAIEEDGFFALHNPATNEITYTRSGSFSMSEQADGTFYLTDANGYHVLSATNTPITLENYEDDVKPAVFDFTSKDGMLLVGNTGFVPVEKNGEPILVEDAKIKKGYIEQSNVEFTNEMTLLVETQRTFQIAIRMLQTSDEITQTINNLRQ